MKKYLLVFLIMLFMMSCAHKDMDVAEHDSNISILKSMNLTSVFWATSGSESHFNTLEMYSDQGRSYASIDEELNLVVYRFSKKGNGKIKEFKSYPKSLQNGSYLFRRLKETYPDNTYFNYGYKWIVYNGDTLKIVRFFTGSDEISSVIELTNHLARSDPTGNHQ